MWEIEPSVFALGRTWCSGFDQHKSNVIQFKEMMSKLGEWMAPRPQLKQPLTTSVKPKKTKKVWQEVQKSHPSTSWEWGDEWN
jgi:hypothetical protein